MAYPKPAYKSFHLLNRNTCKSNHVQENSMCQNQTEDISYIEKYCYITVY